MTILFSYFKNQPLGNAGNYFFIYLFVFSKFPNKVLNGFLHTSQIIWQNGMTPFALKVQFRFQIRPESDVEIIFIEHS